MNCSFHPDSLSVENYALGKMTLCIFFKSNETKLLLCYFHLDDSTFVVVLPLCSRKVYMSGILVLPLSGE